MGNIVVLFGGIVSILWVDLTPSVLSPDLFSINIQNQFAIVGSNCSRTNTVSFASSIIDNVSTKLESSLKSVKYIYQNHNLLKHPI